MMTSQGNPEMSLSLQTSHTGQEITEKMSSPSDEIKTVSQIGTSSEDESNYIKGPWTDVEHTKFMEGYNVLGNKWTQIAKLFVKTRSGQQVACHASKFFKREIKKQNKMYKYHKYVAGNNKMDKVSYN